MRIYEALTVLCCQYDNEIYSKFIFICNLRLHMQTSQQPPLTAVQFVLSRTLDLLLTENLLLF